MPAGLQAFDENGKLIVDVSDYSTRYFFSQNITFPNNQRIVSFQLDGVTADNCFCAMFGTGSTLALYISDYSVQPREGFIDVMYIPGVTYLTQTFRVDVYMIR